jgi:serine/threonine protein kinase
MRCGSKAWTDRNGHTLTLLAGTKFGSYEIRSIIGAGGMGEVYRARDGRLQRDVALKVLPEAFAQDGERMARFEREAQVLASLNHPNIAAVYGLEESGSTRALAMELVEGSTLEDRIARGPVPLDEALAIARQIAEALDAAHGRGVIHRDLKPANVRLTPEGTVKLLDFGLAKALEPESSRGADTQTATVSLEATGAGVILGTVAYMSPEQARGKPVDKRTDIWAFGCVLYELLTATKAFAGETMSDVMAAVLTREPDWSELPTAAPLRLLNRCLEKDPKLRLRDIGDAFAEIDSAFDRPAPPGRVPPWREPLVWALLSVAVLTTAAAAWFWTRSRSASNSPAHLVIAFPPDQELTSSPAISPDGQTVAYTTKQGNNQSQLYLRSLSSFGARPVTGSSGAAQPFFSPDGRWVAFFARGQLLKAAVAGGSPIKVADAPQPYGGTWNEDDTLVFTTALGSGLLRVPAGGGAPESLTKPDGAAAGLGHTWPQALPGGRRVLFTLHGKGTSGTAVFDLGTRRWEVVLPERVGGVFGASGHLFVSDDASELKAAPFDANKPARATADLTVLADVYRSEYFRRPWLAISKAGTLVYAPGNPAKRSLVWTDSNGKTAAAFNEPDAYTELSLSPDGSKAAVLRRPNLWIHDLERKTRSRLTQQGNAASPVWSADGSRIIFCSDEDGDFDIYSQPPDGSKPAERVLKRPYDQFPSSIRSDGTIVFAESHPSTGEDLLILAPDGKVTPLRVTPFYESNASFSPNGAWIAYDSDESGRSEVYVQQYPGGAHKVTVSSGGGVVPVWSRDGKDLYYCSGEAVMAATMRPDGSFTSARRLFDRSPYYLEFQSYAVSPDGKRLLMIHRDPGSVPRQLNVVLNWFEELRHP